MNDDCDLPDRKSQRRGDRLIINFLDPVDFEEMVARSQRADLRQTAGQRVIS